MFKTWLQKLNSPRRDVVAFDPAGLGDPVASKTSWAPLKAGGANFRTQRLVKISSYRIEFRPSMEARVFYAIFLLAGLGMMIVSFR